MTGMLKYFMSLLKRCKYLLSPVFKTTALNVDAEKLDNQWEFRKYLFYFVRMHATIILFCIFVYTMQYFHIWVYSSCNLHLLT